MAYFREDFTIFRQHVDWLAGGGIRVFEFGAQCFYYGPLDGYVWPGDLYHALGVREVVSMDLNGRFGSLARDIREPVDDLGQFDLVTNAGTSEHVEGGLEGQRVVFERLDELCKPGGFMFHRLPVEGRCIGHAPITYRPEFAEVLALAAGYKILHFETPEQYVWNCLGVLYRKSLRVRTLELHTGRPGWELVVDRPNVGRVGVYK